MPSGDGPPATLASVAASAGVSVATVSKVLNGRDDVSPATRARVQSLLAEHDYVARRSDAAARTAQPTVELVFHGTLSGYAVEIMEGVLEAGTQAGIAVVVSVRPHLTTGVQGSAGWARQFESLGRAAVIDVVDDARRGDLVALTRAGIPLVVFDAFNLPRRQVTSVGATNFSGGFAATQHLLSLGHRDVAYCGGDGPASSNQARLHGYRAALEAAGITVPPGYVSAGDFHHSTGVVNGGAMLDLPARPTAIFAGSDEICAGVAEAARTRGLRVPEDLSLVGFDDTEVARLFSPPLTTVRQPLREMGRVALQTAMRLAARERLDSHHVELATELVVRGSTAAPAS